MLTSTFASPSPAALPLVGEAAALGLEAGVPAAAVTLTVPPGEALVALAPSSSSSSDDPPPHAASSNAGARTMIARPRKAMSNPPKPISPTALEARGE